MNEEYHVSEWLPAYALDILTEAELVQVTEHLAACSLCQAELRQYQSVSDELPLALEQTAPSPLLKDRLMKEIHSQYIATNNAYTPVPKSSWKEIFRRNAMAVSWVVILLLVVGNFFLLWRIYQTNNHDEFSIRVVSLAGTTDSPQAVGALMINPSGEYGSLVVDNLTELDRDHQYQVWLIHDGQRVSGGLFSVNSDGYASLEISSTQPLDQYQAIGITIEPRGGSPGPTGAKVLGGDIQP